LIRLSHRDLPADAVLELAALQREVDGMPSYTARVRAAVDEWPVKRRRKVFDAVEEALGAIYSGPRRCMFCEDNGAYQIEHFRPRALYPGLVFAWANFLYACGQCNGSKSARFAVFSDAGAVIVHQQCDAQPADGPPVLLDPRTDDPMQHLQIEIRDTFLFNPLSKKGTREYERAETTIRWLGLNSRDELVEARREAYIDFRARLKEYAQVKRDGGDTATLDRLRRALLRKSHITVWREMQRQQERVDELRSIFQIAPEALRW